MAASLLILPPEILREIAQKLVLFEDFRALYITCRAVRAAFTKSWIRAQFNYFWSVNFGRGQAQFGHGAWTLTFFDKYEEGQPDQPKNSLNIRKALKCWYPTNSIRGEFSKNGAPILKFGCEFTSVLFCTEYYGETCLTEQLGILQNRLCYYDQIRRLVLLPEDDAAFTILLDKICKIVPTWYTVRIRDILTLARQAGNQSWKRKRYWPEIE